MKIRKADYEALAAFRATLRRFLRFSEESARAVGLTPQQHQLLLAIKGQPGREWATVSEAADSLQVRHHTVVGLVDRCGAAGLVVRSPDTADRRQVRVTLTEKGESILDKLSRRNLTELQTMRAAFDFPTLSAPPENAEDTDAQP